MITNATNEPMGPPHSRFRFYTKTTDFDVRKGAM